MSNDDAKAVREDLEIVVDLAQRILDAAASIEAALREAEDQDRPA